MVEEQRSRLTIKSLLSSQYFPFEFRESTIGNYWASGNPPLCGFSNPILPHWIWKSSVLHNHISISIFLSWTHTSQFEVLSYTNPQRRILTFIDSSLFTKPVNKTWLSLNLNYYLPIFCLLSLRNIILVVILNVYLILTSIKNMILWISKDSITSSIWGLKQFFCKQTLLLQ